MLEARIRETTLARECCRAVRETYGPEFALMEIIQGLNPSRIHLRLFCPGRLLFAASTADGRASRLPLLSPRTGTISRIHRLGSYLAVFRHWKRTRPDLIYVNQGAY